jgi:RNA polymerase sigma-70 factor (sigma-E family)
LTTGNRSSTTYIDPVDEQAIIGILNRDFLIASQIPIEEPPALEASVAQDAHPVVTELYRTQYRSLVRLALVMVRDVQTAEEVVQDSFVAMHRSWRRSSDADKALSYLKQSVVNRSQSVLRHRTVVDKNTPKPAPDEPGAEVSALALIEKDEVLAALQTLPTRQREALVLRYYGDLSEAEIAAAMGISRRAVKSHAARGIAALRSILESSDAGQKGAATPVYTVPVTATFPVSIYLADEAIHRQVESTVEKWLATASVAVDERQPPIIGSWFQRMRASAKVALNSEAAHELALTAAHAADARLVLAQDSTITATLLANLGPVIASLQPTKDAVIRVGALLIVKVEWVVQVVQLTAAQQALLDHQPQLASDPPKIVSALQLSPQTFEQVATAPQASTTPRS